MGKLYDAIDDRLREFLAAQRMFFVASAPSGSAGHVNCSPKGLDTFRVLGARQVAYLDYVGSGVETIAHVRENGRIVLMFCSFEGAPKIVRLHGQGRVIEPGDGEFAALRARFARAPALGVRAIVHVDLTRISDSCGYAVPLMKFEAERDQLQAWAERKGEAGVEAYRREKNVASIDGVPALAR